MEEGGGGGERKGRRDEGREGAKREGGRDRNSGMYTCRRERRDRECERERQALVLGQYCRTAGQQVAKEMDST